MLVPCLTNPACRGFQYVRMPGQAETMNLQGAKSVTSTAPGSCVASRCANDTCYPAALASAYMMLTDLAVVKQHMGLLQQAGKCIPERLHCVVWVLTEVWETHKPQRGAYGMAAQQVLCLHYARKSAAVRGKGSVRPKRLTLKCWAARSKQQQQVRGTGPLATRTVPQGSSHRRAEAVALRVCTMGTCCLGTWAGPQKCHLALAALRMTHTSISS